MFKERRQQIRVVEHYIIVIPEIIQRKRLDGDHHRHHHQTTCSLLLSLMMGEQKRQMEKVMHAKRGKINRREKTTTAMMSKLPGKNLIAMKKRQRM